MYKIRSASHRWSGHVHYHSTHKFHSEMSIYFFLSRTKNSPSIDSLSPSVKKPKQTSSIASLNRISFSIFVSSFVFLQTFSNRRSSACFSILSKCFSCPAAHQHNDGPKNGNFFGQTNRSGVQGQEQTGRCSQLKHQRRSRLVAIFGGKLQMGGSKNVEKLLFQLRYMEFRQNPDLNRRISLNNLNYFGRLLAFRFSVLTYFIRSERHFAAIWSWFSLECSGFCFVYIFLKRLY